MKFRGLFLAALLLLGSAAPAAPQETVIRVKVRLVRMLATVKTAAGQLVGSLERRNFLVLDNGVPQEIAVFERQTEQPLSVSVLVDNSGSTGIELKYELDSVNRFFHALVQEGNPNDTAALYTFNWEVRLLHNFTRSLTRLEQRLKLIKPEGGTSLYDAIYLSSQDLQYRQGRHVMVVVTDGGDTTSFKDYHAALESAQMADAVLYPVLVIPIKNEAGHNVGGENALTTLAAGTGGRVFRPAPGAELDDAFAEILRELRTQYLIGYYPKEIPTTKDRFHRVTLKVDNPGLRVVTRSGYYGEFEDGYRTPTR
jgi:Ca-activated chloride channel family protein